MGRLARQRAAAGSLLRPAAVPGNRARCRDTSGQRGARGADVRRLLYRHRGGARGRRVRDTSGHRESRRHAELRSGRTVEAGRLEPASAGRISGNLHESWTFTPRHVSSCLRTTSPGIRKYERRISATSWSRSRAHEQPRLMELWWGRFVSRCCARTNRFQPRERRIPDQQPAARSLPSAVDVVPTPTARSRGGGRSLTCTICCGWIPRGAESRKSRGESPSEEAVHAREDPQPHHLQHQSQDQQHP
jgi:hypothetical protein